MTRSAAREIAIHCSYSLGFSNQSPEEFLEERMDRVHFQRWGEESPLYQDYPMINRCNTSGKWSGGWPSTGLNWTNILHSIQKNWKLCPDSPDRCRHYAGGNVEILYMPEIPAAAAINDAVEIAKKI